jgi:hypothetical protein
MRWIVGRILRISDSFRYALLPLFLSFFEFNPNMLTQVTFSGTYYEIGAA